MINITFQPFKPFFMKRDRSYIDENVIYSRYLYANYSLTTGFAFKCV